MKILLNVYHLDGPAKTLSGTAAYVGVFKVHETDAAGIVLRERIATEVLSGRSVRRSDEDPDKVMYRRVVDFPGDPVPTDGTTFDIEVAIVGDGQADVRLGAVLADDDELPPL